MPSNAIELRALLAVQTLDTQIDRLKATLAALDSGAAISAAYTSGKAEFDQRRSVALRAQAGQRDSELLLASIETKTEQVSKTLYSGTVVGARELKNLQMELDMLGRQKVDAEGKVLEAMEQATTTTNSAQVLENELTALAAKHKTIRVAWKARAAELTKEIAAIEAERAEAAEPIPKALLTRYDTIRGRKGGIGASPLQTDNTCGTCHIKLNVGLIEAIREAPTPQLCEYCGRLLIPLPPSTIIPSDTRRFAGR